MDSTWRPLVEKFCILFWQTRVGMEIVRYKRERNEEMRKEQGGGGLEELGEVVVGGAIQLRGIQIKNVQCY
jgi:hypothetical protein